MHPGGWTVVRTWTPEGYHRSYLARALALLAYMFSGFVAIMLFTRCDVLVAATPPVTVGMLGGLAARLKRVPLVYEIRDLWVQAAAELGIVRSRLLLGVVRAWERSLYRQAQVIVVNSPGFLPHLQTDGIESEKVVLVPNGVDTALFHPAADGSGIRRQHRLEGKFVAAYAGSLGLANDITTILRAADRLRGESDIRILLVGDGNRRRQAEDEARALGLTNVIFTGRVPKQVVAQYLCAADVGICTLMDTPVFRTVYPNKVFDTMACARPVVILVDGVIREVVEQARAGICVRPGDASGLADALLRLRSDPDGRRRMGEAGRRTVAERFDRWQSAKQMAALLGRVTARRRQRAAQGG
ncbi:MAG: hypothetical protein AUH78_23080 [Gemmatimonadetes bacterium 13_1_40CM_4_69_8]|nr:MAG: hypothetical protein AUH78_23080 [Gemmatimonadetes bacterium 13_1_40CM_4_69_8]